MPAVHDAGLFARGFRVWTKWIARRRLRTLDRVDIAGLDHLREALAKGSVVAAANHVCWWDALVILALSDRLNTDFHVIVDQPSLTRYPFFQAAGAIGVDRSSGAASRRGLREALELLERPHTLLWVFPQGRYRPEHLRPMELEGGVQFLARRSGSALVPVSISYPFLQERVPAAFITAGAPVSGGMDALEASLVAGLEEGYARAEQQRFAVVAGPDLAARALGWLVGARND